MSLTIVGIGAIAAFIWYSVGGLPLTAHAAYGAVPVPGTAQLDLPAGDVRVFYEESGLAQEDDTVDIPPGLAVTVRSASGAAIPVVPLDSKLFSVQFGGTGHVPFGRIAVPVRGAYTVTTTVAGGTAAFAVQPRVTLGEPPWNPFGALTTGAAIIFGMFLALALLLRLPLRRQRVAVAPTAR